MEDNSNQEHTMDSCANGPPEVGAHNARVERVGGAVVLALQPAVQLIGVQHVGELRLRRCSDGQASTRPARAAHASHEIAGRRFPCHAVLTWPYAFQDWYAPPLKLMLSKCMWPNSCAADDTLMILLGLHERKPRHDNYGITTLTPPCTWQSLTRSPPVAGEQWHQRLRQQEMTQVVYSCRARHDSIVW